MIRDFYFIVACDHQVVSFGEDLTLVKSDKFCPRCSGRGYYFDLSYDETQQPWLTTSDSKPLIDVHKFLLTLRDDNKIEPVYGLPTEKFIGEKKLQLNVNKLRFDFLEALELLVTYQSYPNYSQAVESNQKIESFLLSEIVEFDESTLGVRVSFRLSNGEERESTVIVQELSE